MSRLSSLLALWLISGMLFAAPSTDRLQQLVAQGQFEAAYQEGLALRDRLAGDPAFDLSFGIAAIDSGHANEGLFALERVLWVKPDHHRARLEYARGLFILGEDAQARREFSHVLERGDPPPAVTEKINRFLDAIRRREQRYLTSARGYVGLGYGYDDNVNSAPEQQLTLITLDRESLGRGDRFTTLSFGGQLNHPLSKGHALFGRWDSRLRVYEDESDQDNANHSLTLGSQWRREQDVLELSLNAQQYLLDDARYRKQYGPTLQWTRALQENLGISAGLSGLILDYADADLRFRDGRQVLANLRLFGNLKGPYTPSWFAGLFYGDERSDAQSPSSLATVDRRFRGAQLGTQLTLSPDLSLLSTLVYQGSDYARPDLFYGINREDDYYALDLELKKLLTSHWQLSLTGNLSRNDSSIELYEYRRKQLGLNVRYEF